MAKRRNGKTERNSGYKTSGEVRNETYTRRYDPGLKAARVREAMAQVQDTTPGVYRTRDEKRATKVAFKPASEPTRDAGVPGEAWDKAQNRSPEIDAGRAGKLDQRQCKSKPASSKGNGTGRKFVPWCK